MILFTGATGFLGSEVFCRLLKKNVPVENILILGRRRPIANEKNLFYLRLKSHGLENLFDKINFVTTDFERSEVFQKTLRDLPLGEGFTVLHMAALIHAGSGDKAKQDRVNVGVTEDLLNFSLERRARHFVFASSIVAFGGTRRPTLRNENDFPRFPAESKPHNYFTSKREAHEFLLGKGSNLSLSILCPGVVHGSLEQFKDSRNHLIALREGRLKMAPAGGSNFVGLDRVSEAFAQAVVNEKVPAIAQPFTQLLVDRNLSYLEFFQLYVDTASRVLGSPCHRIKVIAKPLATMALAAEKALRWAKLPKPQVLDGLAQASLFLHFESLVPAPTTQGIEKSLEESLKSLNLA